MLIRPRKPPDAGYTKLKMIGPGMLKSGLMVMLLLLMMNPTVLLKRDVMLLKTGSVRMYSMMISDILQVETSSDDSKTFNGGGNVPLPVPVDRTEGVAKEVGDQGTSLSQ